MSHCFPVTVTLNSGLSSRKNLSGAYLLYYLRRDSQICCVDTPLGCILFPGHCDFGLASVLEKLCRGIPNLKCGIHFWVMECGILFLGHCDTDSTSGLGSRKKIVPSISPILFEMGIPNFVCGFSVTMTLTIGLRSSRKTVSGAYIL